MTAARTQALVAALAVGQGWAFAQGAEGLPPRSALYLLAQAILALLVVIGIIYLVYFGLRRVTQRQLDASEEGPLDVIQAKHLGGDRWLYVVRIANRTLVVGGGTGQVQAIADLGNTAGNGQSAMGNGERQTATANRRDAETAEPVENANDVSG